MSTSTAPTAGRGVIEFAGAAVRRLTWRFALVSLLIGSALWLIISTNWTVNYSQPFSHWLARLLMAAILTAPMVLATLAADEAVERGARRMPAYIAALTIGALVGAVMKFAVLMATGLPFWPRGKRWELAYTEPANMFLHTLIFGGLAVFAYVNLRSSIAAARTRNAAELARSQARRRAFESQLQAIQARIEPQFLFNTLAHVRALYERDAALAGKALDDLITYLRAALPHLRESSSTLGKEVELADAYLHIRRMLAGERLAFAFDVPDPLRGARFPPMLLLPMVDHALGCGTAAPNGGYGTLSVAIAATGDRLRVTMAISNGGAGDSGDSVQLRNIEERVRALYGAAGALTQESSGRDSARAVLEIPHENADDDPR